MPAQIADKIFIRLMGDQYYFHFNSTINTGFCQAGDGLCPTRQKRPDRSPTAFHHISLQSELTIIKLRKIICVKLIYALKPFDLLITEHLLSVDKHNDFLLNFSDTFEKSLGASLLVF